VTGDQRYIARRACVEDATAEVGDLELGVHAGGGGQTGLPASSQAITRQPGQARVETSPPAISGADETDAAGAEGSSGGGGLAAAEGSVAHDALALIYRVAASALAAETAAPGTFVGPVEGASPMARSRGEELTTPTSKDGGVRTALSVAGPTLPSCSEASGARWRVTFWHVCRSEIIKVTHLRSTWWMLSASALLMVGLGAMTAALVRAAAADAASLGQTVFRMSDAATAINAPQMILSVLGVMFVTKEYSSGQIRTSLILTPTRYPILGAKAVVLGVVVYATMLIAVYATMLVSWLIVGDVARDAPPGVTIVDDRFTLSGLKAAAGLALAVSLVVLFGLALGTLFRSTAISILVLVAVLFVAPAVLPVVPGRIGMSVGPYLISSSETGLFTGQTATAGGIIPAFGFLKALWVTVAWVFVPLLAAGALMKRRDV